MCVCKRARYFVATNLQTSPRSRRGVVSCTLPETIIGLRSSLSGDVRICKSKFSQNYIVHKGVSYDVPISFSVIFALF